MTVIAATNRPDKIDPALLRPGSLSIALFLASTPDCSVFLQKTLTDPFWTGRFDRLLYVGPPDQTDREEIFSIHLRRIPCSSNVSSKELARLTEGFTGADISLICREAAITALQVV